MAVDALPLGMYVIYVGSIRSEYAESYSVQGVCDCPECAASDGSEIRYQLRGEHVMYDPHSRTHERVGGQDLAHVRAASVVPSRQGPQPWQVNQQILDELGAPAPDWM